MIQLLVLILGCGGGDDEAAEPAERDPNLPKLELTDARAKPDRAKVVPGTRTGEDGEGAKITEDQCDDLEDGGPVGGPDCFTARISCNETILGHTLGGVDRYGGPFYTSNHCVPQTDAYDGGDERVYLLDLPDGRWTATATLETPCADLDLAAVRWHKDDESCPSRDATVTQCDMWPAPKKQPEKVTLVSQRRSRWVLVVEGKGDDEEGAFALTVTCVEGLQ